MPLHASAETHLQADVDDNANFDHGQNQLEGQRVEARLRREAEQRDPNGDRGPKIDGEIGRAVLVRIENRQLVGEDEAGKKFFSQSLIERGAGRHFLQKSVPLVLTPPLRINRQSQKMSWPTTARERLEQIEGGGTAILGPGYGRNPLSSLSGSSPPFECSGIRLDRNGEQRAENFFEHARAPAIGIVDFSGATLVNFNKPTRRG